MLFLIDGYNLMHAAGVIGRVPTGSLKSARRRFLDWLADGVRGRADTIRVLFDGQAAPADSGEENYRGLQVRFAYRATADDAIEAELAALPRGAAVVVSDDGRLHEAARRRGCDAWKCARFMDWLIETPAAEVAPTTIEEKPAVSRAEDDLLKAFSRPKVRSRK